VCCGCSRDSKHGGTYLQPGTGPSSKGPTGTDSAITKADSAVAGAVTGTGQWKYAAPRTNGISWAPNTEKQHKTDNWSKPGCGSAD